MFCDVDRWIEIRRRVLSGEISKRQACRQYELHWKTLQKVLAEPLPPQRRASGPKRPSKLDRFGPVIREILDADRTVHRKQRHTAWRIFERLRDEHGYDGGYTIVKEAVRELKLRRKEVFLPLRHDPGEAQVDFGYAYVDLAGERQQVAIFVLSLPYCDAVYCQAFPRECGEVFLEGHRRAFAFFGGVPRRISYDNTKVAVAKIVGSRERQQTREFQRLVGHFLFQPHFCLVGRPNEKGHVERLLDYGRRRCLVPIPKVASLEELNQHLEAWCRRDLQQTARRQSVPKQARLAEDQQAFLPIPVPEFEARRLVPGKADSLSLVCFDRNTYSVPTAYAHRDVTVVAGIEELRIVYGDRLIARHRRCWGRDQTFYEPIHYLALLAAQAGWTGLRQATGRLESAGLLRRSPPAVGSGPGFSRHPRVHQGAPAPGAARAAGAPSSRAGRPGAGHRERRCGAADRGSPSGAADRAVLAGGPAPTEAGPGGPDGCRRLPVAAGRLGADGGEPMTKETKSTVLLKHHLKQLKLPTMQGECEKVAQRCAAENADHLGFLLQLCELELIERERKAAERRLKAAQFPNHKTLDTFDFTAQPAVNKPLVLELLKGDYLDRRENLLLVGNSGTGKTHLATALGIAACQQGHKVRFFRVTELITLLLEAREEKELTRLKRQLSRLDLLILDELGYVPASKAGAELLFDVIATAYERLSVIVTTNLPFESWTEVLGSERLTGAALDRLTHRCHILETRGESYRLQQAKRRRNRSSSPQ